MHELISLYFVEKWRLYFINGMLKARKILDEKCYQIYWKKVLNI